jgi:hypothetical protein
VFVHVNQALINLDLIGITCMGFGSPLAFLHCKSSQYVNYLSILGGIIYLSILGFLFALSLGIFGYLLLIEPLISKLILLRQPLLICLAIIGNFPSLQIIFGPGFSSALRLLVAIGLFGFAIGYMVFFTLRVPERFMKAGSVDGKFWNSHNILHIVASISQLSYVITTLILFRSSSSNPTATSIIRSIHDHRICSFGTASPDDLFRQSTLHHPCTGLRPARPQPCRRCNTYVCT